MSAELDPKTVNSTTMATLSKIGEFFNVIHNFFIIQRKTLQTNGNVMLLIIGDGLFSTNQFSTMKLNSILRETIVF